MAKVDIPTFKLNNEKEIPALGYGTWLGLDEKTNFITEDIPKMMDALSNAIDIGYRNIDTAHLYRVEPGVGEVINRKIKEGVIKRENVYVTSKIWHQYHRETDVEVSVRASLRRLNLAYLDLILIHWPMSITEDGVDEKIDYLETWRGCESVLEKGLVKAIGVSNFNIEQMKRLVTNCKVVPASLQIELNLNLGQNELVEFCHANGIIVVAYSPFGTMVPSRQTPNSPEPKLNNPTMLEIAKKHDKTVTQITLRYLFQRGIVSIPKTVTKSRVLENAQIFDFTLDENDMNTLAEFDNGYRTVRPLFWQEFANYPFDKLPGLGQMEIPLSLRKWKNGAKLDID
uniref:Seminal fluid protein CSSFP010 n=1 Tax=Chilo suppressalis TaxID=168631 RepID=G9F9G1_CHISP|nr:seminal fluid protein CSSFP010 [Chilo suppressalis]